MMHKRFLIREIIHGWRQSVVFVLCVVLSLSTIVALNSFKTNVNLSLFRDARNLHGGDIILHSHYEISKRLSLKVNELEQDGELVSTMIREFYSVVRPPDEQNTLLAKIKVVDGNFPLYGSVDLKSENQLKTVLKKGETIVAEDVLTRLDLHLGDWLLVGNTRLKIVDTVIHESDNPVSFLSFGPRVFVAADDLDELDLVKKGSRVNYEMMLKISDENNLDNFTEQIKSITQAGQVRVNTYRDAESRVKMFFDNLISFLSLISIFTLLLAGLGMQSCLTALIRQKEKTIAITRAVGATSTFLFKHYFIIVLFLGFSGSVLGIISGGVLSVFFPILFEGLLPVSTVVIVDFWGVIEGIVLGLAIVILFTFLPLYRLRNVKPVVIFTNEKIVMEKRGLIFLLVAVGIAIVTFLIVRQLEDKTAGLLFMAGVILLVSITAILANITLFLASKLKVARLTLRQASRSMVRDGNSTRSIIITMSSALSLIFSIYLVEHNLHTTYIESYPEGAPSLFCLDIQPDQIEGFSSFFEEKPLLFPVIRARLLAINGKPVKRKKELKKKRDNFAREFNLTYRNSLLDDEEIQEGTSLFRINQIGEIDLQVSVLDTVVAMGDLHLYDKLLFNIQGVELEAEITSIRKRTKSKLFPFFYFVFPEKFLKEAPQTFFAALQVEKDSIAGLENRILEKYPNISFINVSESAENIGVLMAKLSKIINFFAAFSILAGGLILISSILATRLARIRESVYYKILGSRTSFVSAVFIYENGLLGFISAILALILAHGGSWALCHFLFEIDYKPDPIASSMLVVLTIVFVVVIGLLSTISIVRQKPGRFLREQNNG